MIIKCDVVIESFYYFLCLYVRPFLALWRSRPNYALFNFLTSSLKKYTFYNLLINNILYLCVT